jgi:anti-sigma regulatory factor (Ser/Thr protein kinase)
MQSIARRSTRGFPPDERSVAGARRFVRRELETWGAVDLVDSAVLMTSELVTNAVMHAGGPISVSATYLDATLHVEVHDTDQNRVPDLPSPSAADKTGRGLHIVGLLADRWAITSTPDGKTIWFELT